MGTLLSECPDEAGEEVTDRLDAGDGDRDMDLPSDDVFILFELPPVLIPPSESPSMSEDSLSVSVKCLFLLLIREVSLLLLRGLELLQERSVGSRGGDGEEVDTDIDMGRRYLGCRC